MRIMKLLIGLMLLAGVGRVSAQEMMIAKPMIVPDPLQMEYHNYSYVVKEDGSARAWLRVDGLNSLTKGGIYSLTLPEGVKGEVLAWYRREECQSYQSGRCVVFDNSWHEAELNQVGQLITVTVPPQKVTQQQGNYYSGTAIGIGYAMENVTEKKWWGREVVAASGVSEGIVSNLSIGVTMPDGIYVRDYQAGPSQWAASMSEMMMGRAAAPDGVAKLIGPLALDMAGSGQISKYWSNLMPGEQYQFKFMSATTIWQLFYREIGYGIGWIVAIGVVLSLLLRLIVGRKSWLWYVGVVGLLTLLFLLIGGLWLNFRFSLGSWGDNYPGPIYTMSKDARGAAESTLIAPAEPVGEPVLESIESAE